MDKKSKAETRQNVIDTLNKARSMELLAITQYMNQHYNLDDLDYGELAGKVKLIAIDEMRHAELFAERIKELGGEASSESSGKVDRGQKIEKIFLFNGELEDETIFSYNQFLQVCRENNDSTSVKLFESIIDEEQAHFNYFDDIHGHIERLGSSYLSNMAGTPSDTGLSPSGFVISGKGK